MKIPYIHKNFSNKSLELIDIANEIITEYQDSWELDALNPKIISNLIQKTIKEIINPIEWEKVKQRIEKHKETLSAIADKYEEVQQLVLNGAK